MDRMPELSVAEYRRPHDRSFVKVIFSYEHQQGVLDWCSVDGILHTSLTKIDPHS